MIPSVINFLKKAKIMATLSFLMPNKCGMVFLLCLHVWKFPLWKMDHGPLQRKELKHVGSSISCFLNCNRDLHSSYGKRVPSSPFVIIYYHVYTLRGGSHRLQSNKPKTRENIFLASDGIEPRTFSPESSPCHLSHSNCNSKYFWFWFKWNLLSIHRNISYFKE